MAVRGSRLSEALALHSTATDVAPVLHPGPANRIGERIGRPLRLADARAERRRGEDAAAVSEHPARFEPRARVKDLARQLRGALEALDHIALAYALGIAGRGHHHPESRTRIPSHIQRVEPAAERGFAQRGQVGLEPQEDRLRLRSAEE